MRGRKPEALMIFSPDISELRRIAHSDTSPWYQVRRARIVPGIAAGHRREDLACPFTVVVPPLQGLYNRAP